MPDNNFLEYFNELHDNKLNESKLIEASSSLTQKVQDYFDTNLKSKYGNLKKFEYDNRSGNTYISIYDDDDNTNKLLSSLARDLRKAGFLVSFKKYHSRDSYYHKVLYVNGIDNRKDEFKKIIDTLPINKKMEIIVGDLVMSIPAGYTKEDLENSIGKEALNWLLSHDPLRNLNSKDKVTVFFKASPQFAKLRNIDYGGARRMSGDDYLYNQDRNK